MRVTVLTIKLEEQFKPGKSLIHYLKRHSSNSTPTHPSPENLKVPYQQATERLPEQTKPQRRWKHMKTKGCDDRADKIKCKWQVT